MSKRPAAEVLSTSAPKRFARRGEGSCPSCGNIYRNSQKGQFCSVCKYELGGRYESKAKKPKQILSKCCLILQEHGIYLYSVQTSSRDDRCFVVRQGDTQICHLEACKDKKAVEEMSSLPFSCKHVDLVKDAVSPMESYPLTSELIEDYAVNDSTKQELQALSDELNGTPAVQKVSGKTFAIFGTGSSVSPTRFSHVQIQENNLRCRSKECKNYSATATKQTKSKKICIHLHVLLCSLQKTSVLPTSGVESPGSSSQTDEVPEQPGISSSQTAEVPEQPDHCSRISTIKLNCQRKIPYPLPPSFASNCRIHDAGSTLNVKDLAWPDLFEFTESICLLCGSSLGRSRPKLGTTSDASSYLLTNQHAFQKIQMKVKYCSNSLCKAMHQAWPIKDYGLFNVNDKILVSLEILEEWRELMKRGVPVQVFIDSKIKALIRLSGDNCDVQPSQRDYLASLLYNGFYCYEALGEKSMDDVVCGICGIAGEVYCGDGNEKNCCTNEGIDRSSDCDSPISLEEFLEKNKRYWVEASTYTKVLVSEDVVKAASVPPIIAPVLRGPVVHNTEMKKKSIYLKKGGGEGCPTALHSLIRSNSLEMENLQSYDVKELQKFLSDCKISTSGLSKGQMINSLRSLHETLLVGSSPCHGFTHVQGCTGGFYHIVCRHGTTVASKFMFLQESVRDAADLYLSLKYPPPLFVNDTPCTFTRHLDLRVPEVTEKLWGSNLGCFETPTPGRKPQQVSVPSLVPMELRPEEAKVPITPTALREWEHPMTHTSRRYVSGDRFHTSTGPHKNELCAYHNIELLEQCNAIKTSYQESENNRKNFLRLRSSTMQKFKTHFFYNYLMDFYQNEGVLENLTEKLQKSMSSDTELVRGPYHRLVKVRRV